MAKDRYYQDEQLHKADVPYDFQETCEIGWVKHWFGYKHFEARAIGPLGPYVGAASETFKHTWWEEFCYGFRMKAETGVTVWSCPPLENDRNAKRAFEDLVAELVRKGWRPTGARASWYGHVFVRTVQKHQIKEDIQAVQEKLDPPPGWVCDLDHTRNHHAARFCSYCGLKREDCQTAKRG